MKLTQGAFSFLPELSDTQIRRQVEYCINKRRAVSIEYANASLAAYWEMWGLPLFEVQDASVIMTELRHACKAYPKYYVKVCAFDNTRGVESCVLSFIVQRPAFEPGFKLIRQESEGRRVVYSLESYTVDVSPTSLRY